MSEEIPLGKALPYPGQYSPELLYAVPRSEQREKLGLGAELPFSGIDIWHAWELSWLDHGGLPHCSTAGFRVPADSSNIIESKSLKLYLNSFAMTHYATADDVRETIEQDLGDCAGADVEVELGHVDADASEFTARIPGTCLDSGTVRCDTYTMTPAFLEADPQDIVTEDLYSHLLRSLCPVTGQPDMASVLISYAGPRIDPRGLLRYIVSFREHQDFHESCVERMFVDIMERCEPEKLTIYARYMRRGGIDINPFRSNFEKAVPNLRLWRQ